MSRFLFALALIAVFGYVLSGLLQRVSSHRSARGSGRTDPGVDLVQDPNCLTYLSRKDALEAGRSGVSYYFCSPECAAAFEKKREKNASGG